MSDVKSWEKRYGYLYIDGKYYIEGSEDGKSILKEIPLKDIVKQEEQSEKIAEFLMDKVDIKSILAEALMHIPEKDTNKLYDMLFGKEKKNYAIKTRTHYCSDIKIGNFILPMVRD